MFSGNFNFFIIISVNIINDPSGIEPMTASLCQILSPEATPEPLP